MPAGINALGYMVSISAMSGTATVDTAAAALDLSSDWATYPRECFVTNFTAGTIDTFDHNFNPVLLPGGFLDADLPASYYPSNIQRFGRRLYVTYNLSDGSGTLSYGGPGLDWWMSTT